MAYITYADFTKYYGNNMLDEDTFNSVVNPACSKIDEITRYKVAREGISSLPPLFQNLFKNACIAQCAYYGYYGIDVSFTGVSGQGFTVGKVSVDSTFNQKATAGRNYGSVSPEAISLLEQTGLLNRSVGVYSDPYPAVFWWM